MQNKNKKQSVESRTQVSKDVQDKVHRLMINTLKTMNLTIVHPQVEGMESAEKSSDNIESNVPRQEVLYRLSGLIFSQKFN